MTALLLGASLITVAPALADPVRQTKGGWEDKFRQLEGEDWPTPTDYRSASGAPGHRYWQQKVDYDVRVTLDEARRTVTGTETVRYRNNSPDALPYLWLLLDQNQYKRDSIAERTLTVPASDKITIGEIRRAKRMQEWEGGFTIAAVRGPDGQPLPFTITDSLMRIELPQPVAGNGGETTFSIDWSFPLAEQKVVDGRSGYECFTQPGEYGNCIFQGAQWFPRLAVYSDYEGWHNKAFLDAGEFTLEFGDYRVALTVPADHVVSATGLLQNPEQVLSARQRERLETARTAKAPVYIVTPEEAEAAERGKAGGTRVWEFAASNVRDFGWASSRKFAWDAMGVKQASAEMPLVMAMSFFPKEARPLWDAYSTKAIAHTIDVYSRFSFPYPYPVAQSVNGPVGGMEYPMITFNGPRPVKDRKTGALTYTERAKNGLVGVVIHEIGHNYFPMIVNSDERQWTWMDEGLNTFLQFQAEKLWDKDFPSRRGEPKDIAEYMLSEDQVPLMTQSDSVLQFGANGYGKPATALTILRETILGRELFDRAFREYANRWRFKHPTPYDFFRTMEESSGVDLDWFWRGWFYSTDHVDISLDKIVEGRIVGSDLEGEAAAKRRVRDAEPKSLTATRNAGEATVVERDPATRDFYTDRDRFAVTPQDRRDLAEKVDDLTAEERAALAVKDKFYRFTFANKGGLVMPVILKLDFADGASETVRIPAELWRYDPKQVTWQYVTPRTITGAELDPLWETADADRTNNVWRGRIDRVAIEIEDAEEVEDRMKDSDLQVKPGSLRTYPAPPSK
ncbi:aminopeptidase [Sphingomonas sp. SFZ2018-12]|uniref:M1 family metallopeptidase n=1 Tax=Sphingomonas sp. SFZ2018-12 TaxID=2683197 RepID=UPI001F0ED49C|nr:M1 family metallopeptidase [Sphingomonas sp. SFZ2018-12]MCH4892125.1 aminopeptidase [Sphingomonas sp. SFZ2018-12]